MQLQNQLNVVQSSLVNQEVANDNLRRSQEVQIVQNANMVAMERERANITLANSTVGYVGNPYLQGSTLLQGSRFGYGSYVAPTQGLYTSVVRKI